MVRQRTRANSQPPCSAMSIAATKAAAVKQQRWRTIFLACGRIYEIKLVFYCKAKPILALCLRCEPFMPDPTTLFSFWFDLGGLPDAGAEITLSPTEAERESIARWLGIEALKELKATIRLSRV